MFSDELKKWPWEATVERIYAKSEADVLRALGRERRDVEDFMALISPAAAPYLETMARLSRRLTEERFGRTVSLFIPIYLSNACTNSCVYCGFHRENPTARVTLTPEQMEQEFASIKRLAPFESLLMVTGEHPARAGVEYLAEALRRAKAHFADLKIEVMPLAADEYARLAQCGLNGVVCFQETYNRERYNIYHPRGMKSRFEWRVDAPDRMGAAGLHSVGLGVLVGLEDWRADVAMMARHLRYLQRHYWRTRYSVNFPRMRPAANGGFQPNVVMNDRELAQLIFAMRIFEPTVDISLSTRELPTLRDNLATLGVTTMSAGSKTDPGGYGLFQQSLEQFSVSDERTPQEFFARLRELGREPIWKDWDAVFDR